MSLVRTNSRKVTFSSSLMATGLAATCQPLPALAASRGTFYVSKDSAISAKVETSVAVIVPFESPSNASIEPLGGLLPAGIERGNATILAPTGSEGTLIPEGCQ